LPASTENARWIFGNSKPGHPSAFASIIGRMRPDT
jgi:hypothetical protein